MPLTRTNVTAASRRMLPTYPLFFGLIGVGLLVTPLPRLLATPAFSYAHDVVSIRAWAAAFLALAVAFAFCLIVGDRRAYQLALGAAIVWMTLWTIATIAAAFADLASFTAWAWPAFVARACWASLVSLESQET